MKRLLIILTVLLLITGCGKKEEPVIDDVPEVTVTVDTTDPVEKEEQVKPAQQDEDIIDISFMNSNMIYSEIYNMTISPEEYDGKRIRVKGYFAIGQNEKGETIFGCIVPDALACCQQGLGFELEQPRKYPDEYPATGSEVIIEGDFTYTANEFMVMIVLTDAEMEIL